MSASVERVSLIRTFLARRGDGVKDPIRIIEQYWTDTGELVAEKDIEVENFVKSVRGLIHQNKDAREPVTQELELDGIKFTLSPKRER